MVKFSDSLFIKSSEFRDTIARIVESRKIIYTDHAFDRMMMRKIKQSDIRESLSKESYSFYGKQTERGMVYIVKHFMDVLPTVVFEVNGIDDMPTELNIITTYHEVSELDTSKDDMLAATIERELNRENKNTTSTNKATKNVYLNISDVQRKSLFDYIFNNYYLVNVKNSGRGTIKNIKPCVSFVSWELHCENGFHTFVIEGDEFNALLKAIGYDVVSNNDCLIDSFDVKTTRLSSKLVIERNLYGKNVNITFNDKVAFEKEILKFEKETEDFDYYRNRIAKLMVFQKAIYYSLIQEDGKLLHKVIMNNSYKRLASDVLKFEGVYGSKLNLPTEEEVKLTKYLEEIALQRAPFDSIVSRLYGQSGCELLGVVNGVSIKAIAFVGNEYLEVLKELDLDKYLDEKNV